MLMAIEEIEGLLLEDEEEGEVDLKGELRSALQEIDRLKLKCRKKKYILLKYVREEQNSEVLIQLKVELEEAKKVEDMLLKQIKGKIHEQEKLEEEVVCLRKKLENSQRKVSTNSSQMTSSGKLNEILDAQRSPLIKTGIGYEGESSKGKEKENKNIIFLKENKDDEAAQMIPTKEETCNEGDRNQKEPLITKNETNTQPTEKG